jgi:hypothetical protein
VTHGRRMRMGASPAPGPWRLGGRLVAASLLVHALLLVALARWYRPFDLDLHRPEPAPEVAYLDLPPLPSPPEAVPTPMQPGPPAAASSTPMPPLRGDSLTAPAQPFATEPPDGLPPGDGGDGPGGSGGSGGAVPAGGAPAVPPLQAGFRDPRLYVPPGPVAPPTSAAAIGERIVADARNILLAEPDSIAARKARYLASRQVTILGRKITVFGDSAAAGFRTAEMELRPGVQTLSVDGRVWERLELSRQNEAFVRDSIQRERIRRTRERVERDRARTKR